ncbi:response regulator [Paenibacillus sp. CC-CFT747]|nr:response regulator [Paenibacillus sp. CC-CFT747]
MKSILLVDDHRTFLAGTAFILEKHGYRVTTAAKAADALRLMEEAPFDLFVIDLKLPESSGFELAEAILRSFPEAIVVVLTGEDIAEHFDHLLALGVTAVLEKALGEEELAASLRLAEQRLTVLPVELARRLRATGSPAEEAPGQPGRHCPSGSSPCSSSSPTAPKQRHCGPALREPAQCRVSSIGPVPQARRPVPPGGRPEGRSGAVDQAGFSLMAPARSRSSSRTGRTQRAFIPGRGRSRAAPSRPPPSAVRPSPAGRAARRPLLASARPPCRRRRTG